MAAGGVAMTKDALGGAYNTMTSGMADAHASGGYFKDKISGK